MKKVLITIFVAATLAGCSGCKKEEPGVSQPPNANSQPPTPVYSYEVIATYPHDTGAFTQGLQYVDGILYEGTGREGLSVVRKVDLKTGKVLKEVKNEPSYFGEGIVVFGPHVYQITYISQKGFVYDKETLVKVDSFTYQGEGWGLTTDGSSLIMSNGSSQINFIDPTTRIVTKSIEVRDGTNMVMNINELEYIKGEIWANIWMTDLVARIDPATGKVNSWVNLGGLLTAAERVETDYLNGIAYDTAGDRIFVTGKLWPKLFEIKLKSLPPV